MNLVQVGERNSAYEKTFYSHTLIYRVSATLDSQGILRVRHKGTAISIADKMILTGLQAVRRSIIHNLLDEALQVQPCGVDLTLKRVFRLKTPGVVDFDNFQRMAAETEELAFPESQSSLSPGSLSKSHLLHLKKGAYRVGFNEHVTMPLDIMGQVYTRSSLWRSLAYVEAGVIDAGYKGAVGAALVVANDQGLLVGKNARLAQMVFHQMTEETTGYSGMYQGRSWV